MHEWVCVSMMSLTFVFSHFYKNQGSDPEMETRSTPCIEKVARGGSKNVPKTQNHLKMINDDTSPFFYRGPRFLKT